MIARLADILKSKLDGERVIDTAKRYNVTKSQIYMLLRKAQRIQEHGTLDLLGL